MTFKPSRRLEFLQAYEYTSKLWTHRNHTSHFAIIYVDTTQLLCLLTLLLARNTARSTRSSPARIPHSRSWQHRNPSREILAGRPWNRKTSLNGEISTSASLRMDGDICSARARSRVSSLTKSRTRNGRSSMRTKSTQSPSTGTSKPSENRSNAEQRSLETPRSLAYRQPSVISSSQRSKETM